MSYMSTIYGVSTGHHPRDGWTTELATVQGEEAFLDENGDGVFDESYSTSACPAGYTCECDGGNTSVKGPASCPAGSMRSEAFVDLGEPFIDKNDDGCRNDGTNENCNGTIVASTDPFEEFIDVNGNAVYDSPNGVWDGPGCKGVGCQQTKMIWTDITLAFTGNPDFCVITPSTPFTLGSGASQNFGFVVGDRNLNRLVPGTTIAVTSTIGTLSEDTNETLLDGLPFGPTEMFFTLSNAVCTTCGNVKNGTLTITVTPPAPLVGCKVEISGAVQTD
jgi:hypothetical protein